MSFIKHIVIVIVLSLSQAVMARDVSPEQMEANFRDCTARSPYWTQRWGQYVVAFERNEADRVCRSRMFPGDYFRLKTASCHLDGQWKTAGFYCDELSSIVE